MDMGMGVDASRSSTRARSHRRSSIAPSDGSSGGTHINISVRGHGEDREGGGAAGGGDLPDITRPPMFLMEQDYGNSFKMSTCAPQQQVRKIERER